MRNKLLILTYLFLLAGVRPVFAQDPPTLLTPQNNSSIFSIPAFSWQGISGTVEYNILIDDEPSVTSPYAKTPYYPVNPNYSPKTLNPGTYYWKVKAKDGNGNWSDWSNIWTFILTDSLTTPSPSPTPTQTPNITPSPTYTNNPTNSASTPTSKFTISSVPAQINSDQSFTTTVSLSLPNNPNTNFYLKGAFKKSDGSNYFGLTKVSGNWIKNGGNYADQYSLTTDSSGNWSGSLEVQPDDADSGFTGTADYNFKVGRYTDSGSGPTWSNESSLNITAIPDNIDSSSNQETTTPIPQSSSSSIPLKSSTTTTAQITATSKTTPPKVNYKIASIAGISSSTSQAATQSLQTEVKEQKQINPFLLIGLGLVFAGISSLGYIYLKANRYR